MVDLMDHGHRGRQNFNKEASLASLHGTLSESSIVKWQRKWARLLHFLKLGN